MHCGIDSQSADWSKKYGHYDVDEHNTTELQTAQQ